LSSFIAKWHVALPVFHHSIKNIIYNNIACFCLQTLEMYLERNIFYSDYIDI